VTAVDAGRARSQTARRDRAGAEGKRADAHPGLLRRLTDRLIPRSILARLALLFAGCALVAVVAIYLAVLPSLGSSLRDQKLGSLAAAAQRFSPPIARTVGSSVDDVGERHAVRVAAALSGDRVSLIAIDQGFGGIGTSLITDSAGSAQVAGAPVFSLAAEAARQGRTLTASETGPGGPVGIAALPLRYQGSIARVVLFSGSLSDVQRGVALIRRRILLAGAGALILAALAGFFVARALSLRIRGLQQEAQRVAAGDFSGRFATDARDELGELAQTLDDMQRQLAELDNAREHFIATASHELRTPIFSLGGFLELIQDEDLDEETRLQFIGRLREQVDRLGKLATGLLDLSRLESGALQLHSEVADLGDVARSVTAEFIPALSQHSSRLRLRIPYGQIPVVCDSERVAQILRILIDNALTHTAAGTEILVSARRENGNAHVSVRDYGEGIDPHTLARIFEPFFTSGGRGSGLGLAIARELAERMRGRLSVESEPGCTIFTLVLPS
jgi:signal transduction histidine kinase